MKNTTVLTMTAAACLLPAGSLYAQCPASTGVMLTQSLDLVTDGGNQVACGIAGPPAGTTPNGWARGYNFTTEGLVQSLAYTINSVTFGVQQATVDGINVEVVIYIDTDGIPPVGPGAAGDALELCRESVVVNIADVGTMITVPFTDTVRPGFTDIIVEVRQVDDGTVAGSEFAFRATSNANGQCAPSYIRSADGSCGLAGWTDTADVGAGFPDSHFVQSVSVTLSPGATVATCGNGIIEGCEECDPPDQEGGCDPNCRIATPIPAVCAEGAGDCYEKGGNGTPGCDDIACCAAVCTDPAGDEFCCDTEWDATCAAIAQGSGLCVPPLPPYECNATGGGDDNDCCTTATLVTTNIELPFDTTLSETDGPDDLDNPCSSAADDTNIWKDVWYRYESSADGNLTISNCEEELMADFDSKIIAYDITDIEADPCDSNALVERFILCNEDCADGPFFESTLVIPVLNGGVYMIRMGGYSASGDEAGAEFGTGLVRFSHDGLGNDCPPDLDGDGIVNAADLAQVLGSWGPVANCPPDSDPADFNGDCVVNAADLAQLLGAWGDPGCP